jgi:hypothetical protein
VNEFVEARERLTSGIETLPPRLRETNAAQLLAIVEELRRSCVVELQVVKRVERVDAADPVAVRDLRQAIEDYLEYNLVDRDRTHCHNIDRVADEMRAAGEAADLDRFEALLAPLRDADAEYLDDVEQVVEDALAAVRDIEGADRLEDARAAQDRFRERRRADVERLKATLTRMNDIAGKLIDLV